MFFCYDFNGSVTASAQDCDTDACTPFPQIAPTRHVGRIFDGSDITQFGDSFVQPRPVLDRLHHLLMDLDPCYCTPSAAEAPDVNAVVAWKTATDLHDLDVLQNDTPLARPTSPTITVTSLRCGAAGAALYPLIYGYALNPAVYGPPSLADIPLTADHAAATACEHALSLGGVSAAPIAYGKNPSLASQIGAQARLTGVVGFQSNPMVVVARSFLTSNMIFAMASARCRRAASPPRRSRTGRTPRSPPRSAPRRASRRSLQDPASRWAYVQGLDGTAANIDDVAACLLSDAQANAACPSGATTQDVQAVIDMFTAIDAQRPTFAAAPGGRGVQLVQAARAALTTFSSCSGACTTELNACLTAMTSALPAPAFGNPSDALPPSWGSLPGTAHGCSNATMASEALDRAEATAAYRWTARVVDFGGATATRAAALQDVQTWLAGCL